MILFLPGGPGFSSIADVEILEIHARALSKKLLPFQSWASQPLDLTNKNSFLHEVHQLDQWIPNNCTVVTHSYGLHPFLYLQHQKPRHNIRWIMISPAIDLLAAHRLIFKLVEKDLLSLNPVLSQKMGELYKSVHALFDSSWLEAFNIVSQDPLLFPNYWISKTKMGQFFTTLQNRGWSMDPQYFFKVLEGLKGVDPSYLNSKPKGIVSVDFFIGSQDPLLDKQNILFWKNSVWGQKSRIVEVTEAGHWAHLEQPEQFLQLLANRF